MMTPEIAVSTVICHGIAPFLDQSGGLKVAPMCRTLSDDDLAWIRAHKAQIIEGLRSPNVDYEVQLGLPRCEEKLLKSCFAQVDRMGCTGLERFTKAWALAWGDPELELSWPEAEKDEV
ncbi:MAG: hypothetical protein IJ233_11570 [Pyramidobacter sp.]|nr:hypothetical protein [Pyramidobacter sp.]